MTTPFRPHAIGERPGGYSQLKVRPWSLQGAAAWNNLSEYQPSPRRRDSLLGGAAAIKEAGLFAAAGRGLRAAGRGLDRVRDFSVKHPVKAPLLGAGAAFGAAAPLALVAGEQQGMHDRARQAFAARQARQTTADALPPVEPPGPDAVQQGLARARGFAGENWPWLVGGGLALGGGALYMKHLADRRREEEEQALLGRMYSKTAVASLAREYPVQVGFLARCGELGLTGPEIRAAVEKCAALSDALADEWTGFFAVAAGPEAGAPPGIDKAAQGYDETARTAIARPAPAVPAPLGGAAPRAPAAPAPARAPVQPPAAPRGRLAHYNPGPAQSPGGFSLPGLGAIGGAVAGNPLGLLRYGQQQLGTAMARTPGVNQMIRATPAQVAAGQQARVDALNRGATPGQAARQDPTRDVGVGEAARRFVTELPGAVGGAGVMPAMAALDTTRGLTGRGWDFRHTRGAATEVADPLFHPLGMSPVRDYAPGYAGQEHQQGLFSGNDIESELPRSEQRGGIAGDYARRLHEVHDNMRPALPFGADQAAVGWAANVLDNAGPAAATNFLGSYGGVPGGLASAARQAGWLTGGGRMPAAFGAAQELYNNVTGQTARDIAERRQLQTITGERPPDMTGLDPTYADRTRYEGDMAEQIRAQLAGENERRTALDQPPMTPQEAEQFRQRRWAQAEPGFRQLQRQDFARNLPGLAGPDGQFNPRGQLDLSPRSGYNPRNVAGWLTPERSRALDNLVESDRTELQELTQKLPPEVQQAALNGQLTPEMAEQVRAAGGDVDQIRATGSRLAQATTIQLATLPQFGGDVTRVPQYMEDPAAGSMAASRNPDLAAAARTKVESGAAPDMFTAVSDTWSGMDTLGKILTFGGVGLGLVGLISGLLGEGGVGSILTALVGGGMALFGANRAGLLGDNRVGQGLDAGLQQLGLGHLGSPAQQAVQLPPEAPAAPGAPPPPPGGEIDRLAGLDPQARAQALFPGIGPRGPQGPGQLLAVKQRLEGLSDRYDVDQLRRLTRGIDPALLNQMRQGVEQHRGGWFGFRPEAADELLQALGPA